MGDWEEQLQDLAKEHLGGTDGARSRSEGDPDTPYGADITISEPLEKKQSWLAGVVKGSSKAAKPTGTHGAELTLRNPVRKPSSIPFHSCRTLQEAQTHSKALESMQATLQDVIASQCYSRIGGNVELFHVD